MKYPITLLFRYDKYAYIDEFFDKNKDSLQFSISITNDINELNKLFDSNNHLLLTFGPSNNEYTANIDLIIPDRIKKRWIHLNDIPNVNVINQILNLCYMNNVNL